MSDDASEPSLGDVARCYSGAILGIFDLNLGNCLAVAFASKFEVDEWMKALEMSIDLQRCRKR